MVDTGTDARKKGWAGRQCTVSSSAITIAIVLSGRKSFALGLKGDPAGWEGLTRPPYRCALRLALVCPLGLPCTQNPKPCLAF